MVNKDRRPEFDLQGTRGRMDGGWTCIWRTVFPAALMIRPQDDADEVWTNQPLAMLPVAASFTAPWYKWLLRRNFDGGRRRSMVACWFGGVWQHLSWWRRWWLLGHGVLGRHDSLDRASGRWCKTRPRRRRRWKHRQELGHKQHDSWFAVEKTI
jgi:hypothetical protein